MKRQISWNLLYLQYRQFPSALSRTYTPDWKTLSGRKYKRWTMRHNGILRKQRGKLVIPFRLLIFKVFFLIQGEFLEYIYQFYFVCAIMMCTESENQSKFTRLPENHWVS